MTVSALAAAAATGESQPLVRLELDKRAQSSIIYSEEERSSSSSTAYDSKQQHGGSSIFLTALNITKLCMGTGTLALPFAAEKGGLLFNVMGLALIALWNYYCANCILRCRDLLHPKAKPREGAESNSTTTSQQHHQKQQQQQQQVYYGSNIESHDEHNEYSLNENRTTTPPNGTTSYGEIAWYASGSIGLLSVDLLMLLLSVMLIIAYEVAMISFIDSMPITTGSRKIDIIIPSIIVALLSCSPDVSFLTKFSIFGLMALTLSFSVIVWQGLAENGLSGFQSTLNLWPRDLSDASSWFGVVVFGYGVVPFILNFRESMAIPNHVGLATKVGLVLVFLAYVVMSNFVRILFSPTHIFNGDVLQALPKSSLIALTVRLLMTFVISVTAPLIVVPCGEMIEGKLGIGRDEMSKRIGIRLLLCILCTGVSEYAPGFVHLVSFMGCFCVSITSFVLPPLFCIQLQNKRREGDSSTTTKVDFISYCDFSALVFGILTTILTSIMTFGDLRRSDQ